MHRATESINRDTDFGIAYIEVPGAFAGPRRS